MATIAQNLAALRQAKSDIATAITTKGGTVTQGDGLSDFATDISTIPTGVDTSQDTVTADKLAQGYTAHNSAGEQITGTATIRPLELGIRIDYTNKTFTRLGDAVGLNGGSDFDDFPMYQRRRCNLADDGTVNAYLGDADFAVDGSNGQVMVKQPKFYYKKVVISSSNVFIDEYWISDEPLTGYVIHPAFINKNGTVVDYIYESAYEGYIQNGNLFSISGVAPIYNKLLIADARNAAQSRGTGWYQETIKSLSAIQLLMMIEYGKMNMQEAIGNGNTKNSVSPYYINTGSLNAYGNGTYGNTTSYNSAVQWRGKENPWGNTPTFVDGVNARNNSGSTFYIYVCNSYNFVDETSTGYTQVSSFSDDNGFISRMANSTSRNYLFFPNELQGNSALPVGDYLDVNSRTTSSGWRSMAIGENVITSQNPSVDDKKKDGMFCYNFGLPTYAKHNARLLYIPT